MRRNRLPFRALAFAVVAVVATIAACLESELARTSEQATTIPLQNHDFGDVTVGNMATKSFTISPASGEQADIVNSITEACPDFSVTANGLPAEVSHLCTGSAGSGSAGCASFNTITYTFTATFQPLVATAQSVSCQVTVRISNVDTTLTLFGRGIEPPIRMGVAPVSFGIGEVRVGDTSGPANITVTNFGRGPGPATVMSVAFDSASVTKGFAIASGTTTSHTVAPNQGIDKYTVTCTPGGTGQQTGTLTILTNDPDPTRSTLTVTVTCDGVVSDLVFLVAGVQTTPINLAGNQANGATRVGEPVDVPITLKNEGVAALTIHSLSVTGELEIITGVPAETNLSQNQTTDVVLRYPAANAAAQGSTLGSLVVNHDNNKNRSVNVLGAALPTSMSITPDGSLGPVCVGNTASQQFFVLANGQGTFVITSFGPPDSPFQLTDLPTTPTPVALSSLITFNAEVAPTTSGPLTGTFDVNTDIPDPGPHTITLSALGLPDGVTATPVGAPLGSTVADFGSVAVDETSQGQTITITNCNPGSLTLTSAQIVGVDSTDFAIVISPPTDQLAAGSSTDYVVVMQPKANGARSAELQIEHDTGTLTVPLVGNGIDGDTAGARDSYYACNTGHPGTWPMAIAIALLLRRRRRR